MPQSKRPLAATSLALFLAACAGPEIADESVRAEYLQDAAARVAAVDWSAAETAEVVLDEYSFAPSKLAFRAGTAYRLSLRNTGRSTHYFGSSDFFKAVAVRQVTSAKGDSTEPYLVAIKLGPGERKELFFVAVAKGGYRLECTVLGHAAFGMTGTIRIAE